jgi:hypothetical protein
MTSLCIKLKTIWLTLTQILTVSFSLNLLFFFLQSKELNQESKSHVILLDKAENDMTSTSMALKAQSLQAERVTKNQGGVCWMYWVIIFESLLFVFLLYFGLSNS